MPRKDVKNTKQFNYEITDALADEFRAFCKGRGQSVREQLEIALRRHLDNPPPPPQPVELPPLPPVTPPAPVATAKKPRKAK